MKKKEKDQEQDQNQDQGQNQILCIIIEKENILAHFLFQTKKKKVY